MLKNFESYKLSVELYHALENVKTHGFLKEQILRASSSVALNLAEGSAKPTRADRIRFYRIAFGSLREVQAVLDLIRSTDPKLKILSDKLAAHIYKLCKAG